MIIFTFVRGESLALPDDDDGAFRFLFFSISKNLIFFFTTPLRSTVGGPLRLFMSGYVHT
jgi:hypothetical protein